MGRIFCMDIHSHHRFWNVLRYAAIHLGRYQVVIGWIMSLELIGLITSVLSGFIWIAVIFSGKRGKKIEQIIKEEKERKK